MMTWRGRWPTERRCPGKTLRRLAPFHHRPHQCCRRQQLAWEFGSPASPDTLGWPRHPPRSEIGLVRPLGGGPRRHLYPCVEVHRPAVASAPPSRSMRRLGSTMVHPPMHARRSVRPTEVSVRRVPRRPTRVARAHALRTARRAQHERGGPTAPPAAAPPVLPAPLPR